MARRSAAAGGSSSSLVAVCCRILFTISMFTLVFYICSAPLVSADYSHVGGSNPRGDGHHVNDQTRGK